MKKKTALTALIGAFAASKFDGSKALAVDAQGMDFEALGGHLPSKVESFKEELETSLGTDLEAFAPTNAAMVAALAGAAMVAGERQPRSAPALDGATQVADTSPRAIPDSDVEAYSDTNFANTAGYTFAYNGQTALQDDAIEALFKSVLVPTDKSAVNLTFESDMVVSEITRDLKNGFGKFNRVSIAQAYKLGKLNTTANILVPVVDGEKTESFLDMTHVKTIKHPSTGETIQTAPLKIGKNVALMGISQTPGQVSKGLMDGTDIIDSVTITDVYARIGEEDIMLPLAGYNIDNVRERGIDEDMSIDIQIVLGESNPYRIALNTLTKTNGTAVTFATSSTLFANVALVLTGTGNFESDELALYEGEFKLISVVDVNGVEQDMTVADSEAKKVADAFEDCAITGYDHISYCENQNERRKGDIVNIADTVKQYDIRYKALLFAPLPMSGDKNRRYERAVKALIRLGHARASEDAISILDAHLKGLNNLKNSGVDMATVTTDVITTSAIKPFFQTQAINLATAIDSLRHGKRIEDIQGLIGGKIARAIQAMAYESNYTTAYKLFHNMRGDMKIGINVICGGNVAGFIPEDINVGNEFVVKKIVGLQRYFDNKVIVVFTDLNSGELEATPFGYGLRYFSPEVVVEGIGPHNMNGVRTHIYSRHVVTTDTVAVFTLSGIDAAFGKITQNVSK